MTGPALDDAGLALRTAQVLVMQLVSGFTTSIGTVLVAVVPRDLPDQLRGRSRDRVHKQPRNRAGEQPRAWIRGLLQAELRPYLAAYLVTNFVMVAEIGLKSDFATSLAGNLKPGLATGFADNLVINFVTITASSFIFSFVTNFVVITATRLMTSLVMVTEVNLKFDLTTRLVTSLAGNLSLISRPVLWVTSRSDS